MARTLKPTPYHEAAAARAKADAAAAKAKADAAAARAKAGAEPPPGSSQDRSPRQVAKPSALEANRATTEHRR